MGFKETYEAVKTDPSNGEKNFNVVVKSQPDGSFLAKMGDDFQSVFDAPPGLGGKNLGPSPLLGILATVGACIGAVTKFWSQIMDIPIDQVKVFSRGYINLAGIFGTDDANYKGMYDKLEPIVEIKSSTPKEKVAELMDQVWKHCPIINNFNNESGLEWRLKVK
ncbi:MAG: OsmC family protein [Candidatus Hodarchaeota archaeon]